MVPSVCWKQRERVSSCRRQVKRQATYRRVSLHDADPRVEEVFDEDGVFGVVGLKDGGEEGGDLLGLWREGDGLACSGAWREVS